MINRRLSNGKSVSGMTMQPEQRLAQIPHLPLLVASGRGSVTELPVTRKSLDPLQRGPRFLDISNDYLKWFAFLPLRFQMSALSAEAALKQLSSYKYPWEPSQFLWLLIMHEIATCTTRTSPSQICLVWWLHYKRSRKWDPLSFPQGLSLNDFNVHLYHV